MGRAYWLPPNAAGLEACDGFYIQGDGVYKADFCNDWEKFLQSLCKSIRLKDRSFFRVCAWENRGRCESRFVVLRNDYIDIISEDVNGDIAVFAIIPESCRFKKTALKFFPKYISILKQSLTELYPQKIYKRKNARVTETVK